MSLGPALGTVAAMSKLTIVLMTLGFFASGCRGTTIDPLVKDTYPTHQRKVCILSGDLPAEIERVEIANIKVELNSYGGDRKAKRGLAKNARKIGADAVVKTSFWNTMGAPSGSGVAVVYKSPNPSPPTDCEWY